MQQESSQSDLAERDAPTRSRARRFPGGAAEGAGAEQEPSGSVCPSVRPCVCLPAAAVSLVCLGHAQPEKTSSFLLGVDSSSGYGSIAPVFTAEGPLDAPVPIEEEAGGGGGGGGGGHPCHSSTTRLTHRWSA